MTTAIDYLHRQGLMIEVEGGDRVRVWPASRLTAETRQFIQQRKPEIISELTKMKRVRWLAAVATELRCDPRHLLVNGFIDQHDLAEQLDAAPTEVAKLIRSSPRWSNP